MNKLRVVLVLWFFLLALAGTILLVQKSSVDKYVYTKTGCGLLFYIFVPAIIILSVLAIVYLCKPSPRGYRVAQYALLIDLVESVIGLGLSFSNPDIYHKALRAYARARGHALHSEFLQLLESQGVQVAMAAVSLALPLIGLWLLSRFESSRISQEISRYRKSAAETIAEMDLPDGKPQQVAGPGVMNCQNCGLALMVAEEHQGMALLCPRCGHTFVPPLVQPRVQPSAVAIGQVSSGRRPTSSAARTLRQKDELKGIGGWLLVAIIWMGLGGVWMVVQFLMGRHALSDPTIARHLEHMQSGEPLVYFKSVQVFNGAMLLFLIVTLFIVFAAPERSRPLVIGFIVANLAAGLYDYIWLSQIFSPSSLQTLHMSEESVMYQFLGRLIACTAWALYFLTSQRVKNTLTPQARQLPE